MKTNYIHLVLITKIFEQFEMGWGSTFPTWPTPTIGLEYDLVLDHFIIDTFFQSFTEHSEELGMLIVLTPYLFLSEIKCLTLNNNH